MSLKTNGLGGQSNSSPMFNSKSSINHLANMKYNQPVFLKDGSATVVDNNQKLLDCHVYQTNAIKEEKFTGYSKPYDNFKSESKLNGGDSKLKQYIPHSKPYRMPVGAGGMVPLKYPYVPYGLMSFSQPLPIYPPSFPQGQYIGSYPGLSPMVGPMFGRVIPPVLSTGILV
jgi:hypothetical protein